jgi:putative membrane protein
MKIFKKRPFFGLLLSVYVVLFLFFSISPYDRLTWFYENLTVWLILSVILFLYYRRDIVFSNVAYAAMFVLIYLHTIGGHYTFALVPFDWVTQTFNFDRNHFDRLAHFSVGFYAYPIVEWLYRYKHKIPAFVIWTYPLFAIGAVAGFYEVVEWAYAVKNAPTEANNYLGSQGDVWDAQKDILSDLLGACFALLVFAWINRKKV